MNFTTTLPPHTFPNKHGNLVFLGSTFNLTILSISNRFLRIFPQPNPTTKTGWTSAGGLTKLTPRPSMLSSSRSKGVRPRRGAGGLGKNEGEGCFNEKKW